jgi:hypothetical protein
VGSWFLILGKCRAQLDQDVGIWIGNGCGFLVLDIRKVSRSTVSGWWDLDWQRRRQIGWGSGEGEAWWWTVTTGWVVQCNKAAEAPLELWAIDGRWTRLKGAGL